jgi:hypothetical protein
MSKQVYVRVSLINSINDFKKQQQYYNFNELKYAYSELGFFLFLLFLINNPKFAFTYGPVVNYRKEVLSLEKKVSNLESRLKLKSKKKKRSKSKRIKVQRNIIVQHNSILDSVSKKQAVVSGSRSSAALNKKSVKLLKKVQTRSQSISSKKRKCPSKLIRSKNRAEKFVSFSYLLGSGHKLYLDFKFEKFMLVKLSNYNPVLKAFSFYPVKDLDLSLIAEFYDKGLFCSTDLYMPEKWEELLKVLKK